MDISSLYSNAVLFGRDPAPGIVAVEAAGHDVVEYVRGSNGITNTCNLRFQPFMWERNGDSLEPRTFDSWNAMRSVYNRSRHQCVWNPVQQYLMASGRTLFKNMKFGDLRRLQLDIKTDCRAEYEFPTRLETGS